MIILSWILFGLIAGVVAGLLDSNPFSHGVSGPVVLGILGAVFGGFLANLILGASMSSFDLKAISLVILGSFVLLAIRNFVHHI